MKYYLMNKNAEVGTFELRHGTFGDEFRFEHTGKSPLPIGFDYIEKWIENRKASLTLLPSTIHFGSNRNTKMFHGNGFHFTETHLTKQFQKWRLREWGCMESK